MPSTVSKIFVKVGQTVKKGDSLVALEAMKMEHVIKAPRDGKLKSINCVEGKFVEANVTLIQFEDA
jgi:3-methylcrotonyl-CoA carboxylase alpha subunit